MYMLMPKIPSATTAKGYQQWIPLFSLDCGVGRKIETAPGRVSDRIQSDALGMEMEIIKPIDQSSPLLFSEVCGGPAIPEVKVDMCHSSTDGFVVYLQYILSNVLVSSYHLHVDEDSQYELITLNYTNVEMSLSRECIQSVAHQSTSASGLLAELGDAYQAKNSSQNTGGI